MLSYNEKSNVTCFHNNILQCSDSISIKSSLYFFENSALKNIRTVFTRLVQRLTADIKLHGATETLNLISGAITFYFLVSIL